MGHIAQSRQDTRKFIVSQAGQSNRKFATLMRSLLYALVSYDTLRFGAGSFRCTGTGDNYGKRKNMPK
jgi:hypothetical protein